MTPEIFGASVCGASHVRVGKECQDSLLYAAIDLSPPKKQFFSPFKTPAPQRACALAVADGHGSDSCPFSKDGSSLAVETFVSLMEDYCRAYAGEMPRLGAFLSQEGEMKLARTVCMEWRKRVLARHAECGREPGEDEDAVIARYGTTLLGLLRTEDFTFAFQLGDGDIVFMDGASCEPLLAPEHILGVETHSLSKPDAWKNALTVTRSRPRERAGAGLFMLSTDGFSNSHADDGEYRRSCRGYYDMIAEHGAEAVKRSLSDWLTETSEKGCGDDITVLFLFEPQTEGGF